MNDASTSSAGTASRIGAPSWAWPLIAILGGGFLVRLLFLPSTGFHNDISAFEVIRAIDGPIVLANCFTEGAFCGHSGRCTVKKPLSPSAAYRKIL